MKKLLIILPLFVIGFFAFLHHAQAATIFAWAHDDDTYTGITSGSQNYMNGSGGGCTTNCTAFATGNLQFMTLKFKSQSGGVIIDYVEMLNDLGNPVGCDADDNIDTTTLADGDIIELEFAGGSACDIAASSIKGMKLQFVGGGSIDLYGKADGSVVGKWYQVWSEDPINPPSSGTDDGFSFVNFEPPLQGRTIQSPPYWGVKYTVPSSAGVTPPFWIKVQYATSSAAITDNTAASSTVNVFRLGTQLQNIPLLDTLADGGWFYRISLATSTDTEATWFARNTGAFNVSASSTDYVYSVDPNNPHLVNGIVDLNTRASTTIAALNCTQYPFISSYSAYITDYPFFATTTPQRIGCEIKGVVYGVFDFLLVPATSTVAELSNSWSNTRTVFPFSVPFTIIDATNESIESASSSVGTYEIAFDSDVMGVHVSILDGDTMERGLTTEHCDATCAAARKETIFSTMSFIIWIAAAIGSFKMIT